MGDAGKGGAELIEQAVDWLVSLDCGTADEAAFNRWREADPRHAAAFAQVAAAWRRTTDPRIPMMLDPPGDVEPEPADGLSRRGVAAGFAAVVLAAGGVFAAWPDRASAATAVGERRMVRLPDGSHVMLNTDTRVSWRFDKGRKLWLEHGEAALIVVEAAAPFRLSSDAIEADLGRGRFTVRAEEQDGQLLVLSGRAQARSGGGAGQTIGAGTLLFVRAGEVRTSVMSPDALAAATAWEQGKIVFRGMPLVQAIAEFNRYLATPMVMEDADLATVRLGGEFEVADPDAFLMALKEGFGIDHRAGDGRITLFRAG